MHPNSSRLTRGTCATHVAASLGGLEEFLEQLRHKIQRTDAEVLAAVRQQSTSGSRTREDLGQAQAAIRELAVRVGDIQEKARQSEESVQEICRDIKKLDHAKRHLTASITALRRLSMLIVAMGNLQQAAEDRDYEEASGLLAAVTQLSEFFEPYSRVPKVAELRGQYTAVRALLRSNVFDDFNGVQWSDGGEEGGGGLGRSKLERLRAACLVVETLGADVREEVVGRVCNKEMGAYQTIFGSTGETGRLEKLDRRYIWMKKQLRNKEAYWDIFPKAWAVTRRLCLTFCSITRAQVAEALDSEKDSLEVASLLQALHRSKDFEAELADLFGGQVEILSLDGPLSAEAVEDDDGSAASVRRKYERMRRERELAERGDSREADHALTEAARGDFVGSISACFEPYLDKYVELEEKSLKEAVGNFVRDETWEGDVEGTDGNVLGSCVQVFLHIKKSLKRCSSLTKGETLFNLTQAFERVLCLYATKLIGRLPATASSGSALVASSGTSDWHVKMGDADERVACIIINTAEYCYETVESLAESCAKIAEEPFADRIDMGSVQDEFSGVITQALSRMVLGLETKMDAALAHMARVNWAVLDTVGDQSDYVNEISAVFSGSMPRIGALLSSNNFRFLSEKFSMSFAPRFYAAILRLRRLSDPGTQQLLLDSQAIRVLLLDLPSLAGHSLPPIFSKNVTQEMNKSETLLKVILSPPEALGATFLALMPSDAAKDFAKVLDLKGIQKNEQRELLEHFNNNSMEGAAPSPSREGAAGGMRQFAQGFKNAIAERRQAHQAGSVASTDPGRVAPGAAPGLMRQAGGNGGASGNQFGLNFDKMKFSSGFGGKFRTGGAGQAFSKMFNKDKGAGGD